MRFLIILMLIPALQGCFSKPPKPSVSVEKALFSDQWNLAVLDLQYVEIEGKKRSGTIVSQSAGSNAGQIIASLLANEIGNLDNIDIVERGQIDNLIGEQKLQLSGIINAKTAVEIGQVMGANAVLIGNVSDYVTWSALGLPGSTVSFSMRVINVKTGHVITSGSITRAENFTSAFQNAQNLARELIKEITRQ